MSIDRGLIGTPEQMFFAMDDVDHIENCKCDRCSSNLNNTTEKK